MSGDRPWLAWRESLITSIAEPQERDTVGPECEFSITSASAVDWPEAADGLLTCTVTRRAIAERCVNMAEEFCKEVIRGWGTDDVPETVRRQTVERLARASCHEYLARLGACIAEADVMLRELSLAVAVADDAELRDTHLRTITGNPQTAVNRWLDRSTLHRWLMAEMENFLGSQMSPVKPAAEKKGTAEQDLALYQFVARTRNTLQAGGMATKKAQAEAKRLACERFGIKGSDGTATTQTKLFHERKSRGKKLARELGTASD